MLTPDCNQHSQLLNSGGASRHVARLVMVSKMFDAFVPEAAAEVVLLWHSWPQIGPKGLMEGHSVVELIRVVSD